MSDILSGSELYLALLAATDGGLRRRIFDTAMLSLGSGLPGRVSVRTTDGSYHYLVISTRISTDTENETGGIDTA